MTRLIIQQTLLRHLKLSLHVKVTVTSIALTKNILQSCYWHYNTQNTTKASTNIRITIRNTKIKMNRHKIHLNITKLHLNIAKKNGNGINLIPLAAFQRLYNIMSPELNKNTFAFINLNLSIVWNINTKKSGRNHRN